ncbi:PqqD family peptide modification chaperone [Sphingomonas sp. LB-2]|uniref:PqqD family protein n=1 Tax=Sphingomonas caeni TaxID=2984949 RepID=UPI002231690D|nr:PqqD family protein [Sphingomonas caeni]MCW3846658.1 PqqD family peptide modification chaperone [Sphingomonas caeni]
MIAIAPQLSWPPVAGELAVYDSRDGRYHVLNLSAAEIWRRIAAGKGAAEIAAELAETNRAPLDKVRRDVDAFIAGALDMGLLVDG